MFRSSFCALAILASVAAPAGAAEVEAPGPLGPLRGTLVEPAGDASAPLALIVPGSGPTDRDGNNPYGMKAAVYSRLAADLAARGVASVRIDKRGLFGSARAIRNPFDVTVSDYADDLFAWAAALRQSRGADGVWLIGHSEGGLVALAAAARDAAPWRGLVLLATPGRPVGEVLRGQLADATADADFLSAAADAIGELEAGRTVPQESLPAGLQPLLNDAVQPYLIDLLRYDPARLAAATDIPMLIAWGDADLQVAEADFAALAAARPDAATLRLPGINHVFKAAPADDRHANFAAYADPDLPLPPALAEAIAEFLLRAR